MGGNYCGSLLIYLKYRQAAARESQKIQRADIETLFGGRK